MQLRHLFMNYIVRHDPWLKMVKEEKVNSGCVEEERGPTSP